MLDAWILAELAGLQVGVVIVQGALSARHLRHLDPVVQRPLDCLLEDQAPGRNPNRREGLRRERVAGRFSFYIYVKQNTNREVRGSMLLLNQNN